MSRIALAIFVVLFASACTTTHTEPDSSSPRALISGVQKNCVFACKAGVFINAINGVEVSKNWKTNGYYMVPGPTSVLVSAVDAGLYGVCELRFNVIAGEEYKASHKIKGDKFEVVAADRAGKTVASCVANMGPVPPSAPAVPIIVPVG